MTAIKSRAHLDVCSYNIKAYHSTNDVFPHQTISPNTC